MNEAVEQMVSMGELTERIGLSRSTIIVMVKEGDFPRPIKLGARRIGWRVSTVNEWIAEREETEE